MIEYSKGASKMLFHHEHPKTTSSCETGGINSTLLKDTIQGLSWICHPPAHPAVMADNLAVLYILS